MSLVGNLEDLGLGEILQIVGLSGRSGRITLKTPHGEGWIWLEAGNVRGAAVRGGAQDLAELLARTKEVDADVLARARARAGDAEPLAAALLAEGALDAEALEELLLAHTQQALREMFRWERGDFLYETGGEAAARASGLLLERGLSAQFVALECARLDDEDTMRSAAPLVDPTSDERDAPEAPPEPDEAPALVSRRSAAAPAAGSATAPRPPVVALDESLAVLEWVKSSLGEDYPRVHIFQRSELAIDRIRQYLRRGQTPLVLLAEDAPRDPLTGAEGGAAIAERLRTQAPRMPIVLLADAPGGARDPERPAQVGRPPIEALGDEVDPGARDAAAAELREALRRALGGAA